jgi:YbbR domain-containing protein
MKKIFRFFKGIFHGIYSIFDKWIITPITKFILKIIDASKNNNKGLERLLNKKSTLIIISLLLAFTTFYLIDRNSNVTIDQYAEVLYKQKVTASYNEELYVVEGLPQTVDITLIGQKRHIFLAKQTPTSGVTVDLTGLKPGNHKVTLKYSQQLKSVDYRLDPSTVTVTIYEKVSQTKSLTYDILHKDNLDSKLYIKNVELSRDNVIIKGAEYKLKKVATVKALIDVNNLNNPKAGEIKVKDVPLVAYDNNGEIVDVEIVPSTIEATLTITSPSKEVDIKIIPKGDLAFGKSIKSITPSITKVTVYGEEEVVAGIDNIEVPIDVKGLDSDKRYNITLTKPSGITELSTKTITVKVELDTSVSKEFAEIPIETENLNSKYAVQALNKEDSTVTVVVSGSKDTIDKITAQNIKAYIDLKDYGVGEHEVEVKVKGDDLKLTYASKTKKVKIRITEK